MSIINPGLKRLSSSFPTDIWHSKTYSVPSIAADLTKCFCFKNFLQLRKLQVFLSKIQFDKAYIVEEKGFLQRMAKSTVEVEFSSMCSCQDVAL